MNNQLEKENIKLHKEFWAKRNRVPIVSYRKGDFFFSTHFKAAKELLIPGKVLKPESIDVASFLPDYERMYQESLTTGQSAFWVAEPYTGIPWMEAILGCEIIAGESSFTSEPITNRSVIDSTISLDKDNPWLAKYLEFTKALVELSYGRFPVGQPIMRGPTDMTGALLGQTELIFQLIDKPLESQKLIDSVTNIFLKVISMQNLYIPSWNNGFSIGFYHVWAPDRVIWFQEDLSGLLSPDLYQEFYLSSAKKISRYAPYNAVHLHPSSFFIVDELLSIDELKAVEINKDIGGPSVEKMLPVLKKIMECKNLILWGDFTIDDLRLLEKELPAEGLFLNIVKEHSEDIEELSDFIQHWKRL